MDRFIIILPESQNHIKHDVLKQKGIKDNNEQEVERRGEVWTDEFVCSMCNSITFNSFEPNHSLKLKQPSELY